jgi:CRISPR-associated endonuclease/helicase Cas3
LVDVQTGLGKTAMAVVGWLWRRFGADESLRAGTPRRLVYCLPMRVLVEQTRQNAAGWVARLRDARRVPADVPVHVLMGGDDDDEWDTHPERDAIIVGTQDMLLSRALNRGYAASRSRWPMQFGLLHTDCLWVFDEVQLMGSGLATTAQLEAFRHLLGRQDGHGCRSVWMSATLRPEWLKTVDFGSRIDEHGRINGKTPLSLSDEDHGNEQVRARWNARKPLAKADSAIDDPAALADEVRRAHRPGSRTIVVVNTVRRACALFDALSKAPKKPGVGKRAAPPPDAPSDTAALAAMPKLVLLHSRFRPADRADRVAAALAEIDPNGPGTIIVSTQVIEAGVDVSATTLFSELAPWASLVQRFGRCNRRGGEGEHACVKWIGLPAKDQEAEKVRRPYDLDDLRAAAAQLAKLNGVDLGSLAAHSGTLSDDDRAKLFPCEPTHVIRRRDLIDLFDTTPELAGNDIDIDRFVREVEDSDVRVFWRAWERASGREPPPAIESPPRREELCPVPVGEELRDFVKAHRGQVWRWDFVDERWQAAESARIAPGQAFLVHAEAGGYTAETGWAAESATGVTIVSDSSVATGATHEGTSDDRLCRSGAWLTIAEHTDAVCRELDAIAATLALGGAEHDALRRAARWHDRGKAHAVFVGALPDRSPDPDQFWAKGAGVWKRYARPCFRHELASALAILQVADGASSPEGRDLAAYLVAAHHGKVRLSIRSLPNELRPDDGGGRLAPQRRFARGVWDGDELPGVELGGGVTAPKVTLSLEPMELGLCEQPPFVGQPSWAERMIGLRDTLGPFRLAYLEAIVRAADMRASEAAGRQAVACASDKRNAGRRETTHG